MLIAILLSVMPVDSTFIKNVVRIEQATEYTVRYYGDTAKVFIPKENCLRVYTLSAGFVVRLEDVYRDGSIFDYGPEAQ